MDKAELVREIKARAPWYQRITFPGYDVTTTDDRADAYGDAAWDNAVDGIAVEDAAVLRPVPKWNQISRVLPDLSGLTVLEIGSNCGFFSFEFAKTGAKQVYGIDLADKWLGNAEFCRGVLGLDNVAFSKGDFMTMGWDARGPVHGRGHTLLSFDNPQVPLPTDVIDVVFMSTVLDHLFFPLFALYKMVRMARRHVIVDVPTYHWTQEKGLMKFQVEPGGSHHGFVFTADFIADYLVRLGVPRDAIRTELYNSGRNITLIIDVTSKAKALIGA